MPRSTTVSIVVATRNRAALLARTLDGLIGQAWPRERLEIVVADNGSTDETAAVVRLAAARADAPAVRYLHVGEPGKSRAVNAALAVARGDTLALTDDDVVPAPDWVARLQAAIDETGADFVAGRIRPDWEAPPPAWMSPALFGVLAIPDNGPVRVAITPGATGIVPIGANMAVRAGVLRDVGGLRVDLGKLDGTLQTGEDHELFLRMLRGGYRGVYEPTAVVHHFVPRARLERQYCRRWLYQNGRDVARLEAADPPSVPRLLGVPRYLWRQAAGHAQALIRATLARDPAARFAAGTRLLWLAGYARQGWFAGGRPAHPAAGQAAADPSNPVRLGAARVR